jgi:hypothetical protein
LSSATGDLTAILARASEKSREALDLAQDEAQAWLEEVQSGSLCESKQCVTCGREGALEDNHVAGHRHGELTVPMCAAVCHPRFTEGQDLWPAEWQSVKRSADLDLALLLLGLHDLLLLRARNVPEARAGAYVALAESVREQYARVARRTL